MKSNMYNYDSHYVLKDHKNMPNFLQTMLKNLNSIIAEEEEIRFIISDVVPNGENSDEDIIYLSILSKPTNYEQETKLGVCGIDVKTFKQYWKEETIEKTKQNHYVFNLDLSGTLYEADGKYEWRVHNRRTYVKYYPIDAFEKGKYYKARATCHKDDFPVMDAQIGVLLACNRAKIKYLKDKITNDLEKIEDMHTTKKTVQNDNVYTELLKSIDKPFNNIQSKDTFDAQKFRKKLLHGNWDDFFDLF